MPRSVSLRSLRLSDEDVATDASSQAIESSDEEGNQQEEGADGPGLFTSELVMPSIRMPKRRPFTQRGREIGKLKIAVAGGTGQYIRLTSCGDTDSFQAAERPL